LTLIILTTSRNMKMAVLALVCRRVREQIMSITPNVKTPTIPVPVGYQKPYFYTNPEKPQRGVDLDAVSIDIYLFDPVTLLLYKLDPWF
jgi:hypothetical protein